MVKRHDWRTGRLRRVSEILKGKELILPDLAVLALLPDDPTGVQLRADLGNRCAHLAAALLKPQPSCDEIHEAQMSLGELLVEIGSGMEAANAAHRADFPPDGVMH